MIKWNGVRIIILITGCVCKMPQADIVGGLLGNQVNNLFKIPWLSCLQLCWKDISIIGLKRFLYLRFELTHYNIYVWRNKKWKLRKQYVSYVNNLKKRIICKMIKCRQSETKTTDSAFITGKQPNQLTNCDETKKNALNTQAVRAKETPWLSHGRTKHQALTHQLKI